MTKPVSRPLLRQATRADIAGMQRVRHAVRENPMPPGRILAADYIEEMERTGRGWVVEAEGEVLGFAIGNAHTGTIWALFVDPAHEGRGFGRQLHDAMVAWLWQQGLQRLRLGTDPDTRAARFYERAGWRRCGQQANGEILFELRPPRGSADAG